MQKYDEEEFLRDAEEMKNKVSKIKLSEEFKAQLQEKMDLEFEKETVNSNLESDNKIKLKLNNLFFIPKFAVALCLIVLVSGCITFADEIESFVSQIFSNTDRELEMAIENGEYQELDIDYIKFSGGSIKIDCIVKEENALYITFNILTEDEWEKIYIKNAEITNDNGEILFSNEIKDNQTNMIFFDKWINKSNFIIIYKLDNLKNIKEVDKIKIKVNEIYVEKPEYSKNFELQGCEFSV